MAWALFLRVRPQAALKFLGKLPVFERLSRSSNNEHRCSSRVSVYRGVVGQARATPCPVAIACLASASTMAQTQVCSFQRLGVGNEAPGPANLAKASCSKPTETAKVLPAQASLAGGQAPHSDVINRSMFAKQTCLKATSDLASVNNGRLKGKE